jgi:hypothetical protein
MNGHEIGKLFERDEIFALQQKMLHDAVPFRDIAPVLPIGSSLDRYEPVGYMSSVKRE